MTFPPEEKRDKQKRTKFYLPKLSRLKILLCEIFALSLYRKKKIRMRIVSHKKIKEFYETKGREDTRVALERWYDITEKANWRSLSDIKVDFPGTDYVGNQHYVFNIRGNSYRLIVVIKFTIGYVYIRWVGTHKEYEKIDCSTI